MNQKIRNPCFCAMMFAASLTTACSDRSAAPESARSEAKRYLSSCIDLDLAWMTPR